MSRHFTDLIDGDVTENCLSCEGVPTDVGSQLLFDATKFAQLLETLVILFPRLVDVAVLIRDGRALDDGEVLVVHTFIYKVVVEDGLEPGFNLDVVELLGFSAAVLDPSTLQARHLE
jgi:hypothetical protein